MKRSLALILSILLALAITIPTAAISTVPLKSISLDEGNISMKVGDTANIKVTLSPANTTQKLLSYATNNKKIAAVDASGKISAIGAGTALITVSSQSDNKIFTKCVVSVEKVLDIKGTVRVLSQRQITDTVDPGTGVKTLGMNALFDKFNKEFPNIKITAQYLDAAGILEKLQTLLLSNQVDVFYGSYEAQYQQGLMLNLRNMINKKDPGIWDTWQDGIKKTQRVAINDNQIMGLPGELSTNTVAYDKKLFEDYGVEPLSQTPTPEEIMTKAKALTGIDPKTGKKTYGIYYRGKGAVNYFLDEMNNGWSYGTYDRMDLSKSKPTLNTPGQKEKIEKLLSYVPYCTPGVPVDQGSEKWGTVDNDVAIFFFYMTNNDDVVIKNKLQDRFVITEGVKYNGTVAYISPLTWGIARGCSVSNTDAAWELIKYCSGPVGQNFMYDNYRALPSLRNFKITDPRDITWMNSATGESRNNYFPAFLFSDFRPWLATLLARTVDGTKIDIQGELDKQQAIAEAWVKTQKPLNR